MNELIKSRPTDLENKLTVSKGEVGGRDTLGGCWGWGKLDQ